MKRTAWLLMIVCLVAASAAEAQEQPPTLTLGVHRDFGFQASGRIQGAFSLTVEGSDDLVEVEYLIDGEVVGVVTEAPFRWRFNTGDYSLATHVLAAVATTTSGERIGVPGRSFEFVTADEGWQFAGKIALPILGLVIVFTLVGTIGPLLGGKKKTFRRGEYGVQGGAICPRCGLPFSRHLLALNMVLGKLERCPHCGKWSIVRRATPAELQAAEARLVEDSQQGAFAPEDEADRLRRQIEESRFEE
jgi:hypothetical protein